ncbi:hypothetical protein GCM10009602_24750 [Nocardiopsis tropica]
MVRAEVRAQECGVRPEQRCKGGQGTKWRVFRSHYRWHVWRLTAADDRSVISTLRAAGILRRGPAAPRPPRPARPRSAPGAGGGTPRDLGPCPEGGPRDRGSRGPAAAPRLPWKSHGGG